jgi:hypothetical protein
MQSFPSSCVLLKNIKIRICKTIILPVVLYGCGTWSLILREGPRLGVFEIMVLRRISRPKRDEMKEYGENCITGSCLNCTLCQV